MQLSLEFESEVEVYPLHRLFFIQVVLPEGSTVVNVEAPFHAELSHDKKHTYLDTGGRPVVVLTKSNVALDHNQPFIVDYTFSSISMVTCNCSIQISLRETYI